MIEAEVKIRARGSPGDVIDWFKKMGFREVGECFEEDHYFTHPCRDFKSTDEALRYRIEKCNDSVKYFLTYKGPRRSMGVVKVRDEIEVGFDQSTFASLIEVFRRLGFVDRYVVRKRRIAMSKPGLLAYIDIVEDLGLFVELEGILDEEITKKIVSSEWFSGFVGKTYLEMLLEK
ncbi:class IV adenylate cyclase [Thermogladius sp. 4427co]|uniref:class IV adenylate cyclase n=1 Tax=Thermogladius sp. 4427co TaxID=3450718 RepID=UPI003F79A13F